MRPGRRLLPATFCASLRSSPGLAQANTSDPNTREVLADRLTIPKPKQLDAAMATLHRKRNADPACQQLQKEEECAALREEDQATDADQDRCEKEEQCSAGRDGHGALRASETTPRHTVGGR